ncbi:hypothetical protein C7B62_13685 [Pleurocapsa sp. CCALA 161]|uniref:hypothetical protein n=1 Tax=Pleurocapsa sp. CCALA 161 TaxID=2107688 RepID=UPI000D08174E|nr:hypothetical protein [Pleurocapsa sp. CCALA 161]PSB09329.1 hypothetical protein C7B62_13685 [Pleurocapsa sp. CCALA 161]
MVKFHLGKFLALLLTGCLLVSLPQIINYFAMHDPVTHQLEKAPKQIDSWRQSGFAIITSQRAN